jgi:hypothetical protein
MDDWRIVTEAEPWKVGDADVAAVGAPYEPFRPTREFAATFPQLTDLLGRARLTEVRLPTGHYTLFAWGETNSDVRAWLCPVPPEAVSARAASDHLVLLECFGGITERFNEPPDNWLLNHNNALTAAEVGRDASFVAGYSWAFEDCGGIPISVADWYPAAWEANGNCILCSRDTGELLFFAPDHADGNLVPYGRCPMYTLHTHRFAGSLLRWVEGIAMQWTDQGAFS